MLLDDRHRLLCEVFEQQGCRLPASSLDGVLAPCGIGRHHVQHVRELLLLRRIELEVRGARYPGQVLQFARGVGVIALLDQKYFGALTSQLIGGDRRLVQTLLAVMKRIADDDNRAHRPFGILFHGLLHHAANIDETTARALRPVHETGHVVGIGDPLRCDPTAAHAFFVILAIESEFSFACRRALLRTFLAAAPWPVPNPESGSG